MPKMKISATFIRNISTYNYKIFPQRNNPQWPWAFSVSRPHDHAQTRHTRQDSSGRVISPMQGTLPDNTQQSQEADIHASGRIQTHNPGKRGATDPIIGRRGHWDRLQEYFPVVIEQSWTLQVQVWSCELSNKGSSWQMMVRLRHTSGVPRNFVRVGWGGSTNSVEDRGQRERGSGDGSPVVRCSGGSCNLVQKISFHIVKFS